MRDEKQFVLCRDEINEVYDVGFSTGFVVWIFAVLAISLLGLWVWQ